MADFFTELKNGLTWYCDGNHSHKESLNHRFGCKTRGVEFDAQKIASEYLDEPTRQKLVSVLRHHGQEKDAHFFEGLRANLRSVYQINLRELGLHAECELSKIKVIFQTKKEFCEYLQTLGNTVVYDREFLPEQHFDSKYITELQKHACNFTLSFSTASGTRWESQRRILVEENVVKLTDPNTGSNMIFTDLEDSPFLHVLIFEIPKQHQGNYFRTRAILREFFDALTAWNDDVRGIESLCLGSVHNAPEVRGKEWRLAKIHGVTKLELLWKRLGGCTPMPNDPHRLYLLKFKDALELVQSLLSEEAHGLYGHLHRSIYSPSEEQQLKTTIAALSTKST
jgi:hypothetical protein